jgi:hypothetical protein
MDAICAGCGSPRVATRGWGGEYPTMLRHLSIVIILVSALAGCTQYEFVITEPAEHAGRLTRQERTIERDPLIYHLVDQSNRLGVRIENPTDDAIELQGEASYVVTPDGESQPLRSGTIAPHTWSGFTVPPVVREYRSSGSVGFGIGVGTFGHDGGGFIGVGHDPFYDDFAYVPRDTPVWTWKTGLVRVHLVYERQGEPKQTFEHDFTIERRKVE